ncbi:MAG: hypothetical protein ACI3XC_03370, partial [Phascolarctobacterium sp.]
NSFKRLNTDWITHGLPPQKLHFIPFYHSFVQNNRRLESFSCIVGLLQGFPDGDSSIFEKELSPTNPHL